MIDKDTNTAEQWHDLQRPLVLLRKALDNLPNPPVPDDGWGQKMNDLNRAVEGLEQTLAGRLESEYDG